MTMPSYQHTTSSIGIDKETCLIGNDEDNHQDGPVTITLLPLTMQPMSRRRRSMCVVVAIGLLLLAAQAENLSHKGQ